MPDPRSPDPLDRLDRLAPDVDTDAAHRSFRSLRKRRTTIRRAAAGLIAAVAIVGLVIGGAALLSDDNERQVTAAQPDTSDAEPPVGFTVIAVEEATAPMGTLRAVYDQAAFIEQWQALETGEAPPQIDFGESFGDLVVVFITIPDDACPPELTEFTRNGDEITPVFEETVSVCEEPLIPKTYVVALDLTTLPEEFTLVLPAYEVHDIREQRLTVDIQPVDGEMAVPELIGTTWQVTGFIEDGRVIDRSGSPPAEAPGRLVFEENGFVTGFNGCNGLSYAQSATPGGSSNLGTTYDIDGDRVTLTGGFLSTLVLCEDEREYQDRFHAVLSGTVTWDIEGSDLTLLAPDGRGVTYTAVS